MSNEGICDEQLSYETTPNAKYTNTYLHVLVNRDRLTFRNLFE